MTILLPPRAPSELPQPSRRPPLKAAPTAAPAPAEPRFSRRNVLKVVAAALALPIGVLALRQVAGAPQPVRWAGETMGTPGSITLWHRDPDVARRTLARMQVEVERLERIFSLYRPESEIVRLNRDGRLLSPSRDMVAVLEASRRISEASGGAFDPTVQPLWLLYSAYFDAHPEATRGPESREIDAARAATGYAAIDAGAAGVGFARQGMAITLNGIAEGYITDRITDLLRNEGFDYAMVELGETRALGAAPDGKPFPVHLMNPTSPQNTNRVVELADLALSVSGGYGLRFAQSDLHHIFDPATGLSPHTLLDVAVTAPTATAADGLSTAIFVAGEGAAPRILAAYTGAKATITRADGTTAQVQSARTEAAGPPLWGRPAPRVR